MSALPLRTDASTWPAGLLAGAMAVLVALGSFLAGPTTCQGKVLQQATAPVHATQQPVQANTSAGEMNGGLLEKEPSARTGTAISLIQCVLLPAGPSSENHATLRASRLSERDLDHAAPPTRTAPVLAALIFSKRTGESFSEAPSPSFSFDSSSAQESLSVQRTVVLRL